MSKLAAHKGTKEFQAQIDEAVSKATESDDGSEFNQTPMKITIEFRTAYQLLESWYQSYESINSKGISSPGAPLKASEARSVKMAVPYWVEAQISSFAHSTAIEYTLARSLAFQYMYGACFEKGGEPVKWIDAWTGTVNEAIGFAKAWRVIGFSDADALRMFASRLMEHIDQAKAKDKEIAA